MTFKNFPFNLAFNDWKAYRPTATELEALAEYQGDKTVT